MKFTLIGASKAFAINPNDNLLSVLEIVEQLNSPLFPITIPQLCFYFHSTKAQSEPNEMPVECEILNNGKSIKPTIKQTLRYGVNNKNRYVVTVQNLQVNEPGELSIVLYYNNRKDSISIPIDVIKIPMPVQNTVSPQIIK